MCGIAGILGLDGRSVDRNDVVAITRALAHRGPDGEGIWVDGGIGLGHRRLAILDLSERGVQPMVCVDGRYVITFNGEIFNFVELRLELERLGQRFYTETDTEVIAHAFHVWGEDCLFHFNGMWSFAIWDVERRELFASRDHFGIKPFHYRYEAGRRFVFASELKSFLFLRDFTPRENEAMTRRALLSKRTVKMVDETLIEGVQQLRAGHNLKVSERGIRVWRWWRTYDHAPEIPKSFEEQVEAFRELFIDACKIRMRSDVPIGTCLSGGVDSSAILCTVAKIRNENVGLDLTDRVTPDSQSAFVATYPGTAWDERTYAQTAIEHAGAKPHFETVTSDIAVDELSEYAYNFEAIGGTLVIQMSHIYSALRRDGIVVSIDGQGGDELLAGYTVHVEQAELGHSFLREPVRTLSLLRTRYGMYGKYTPFRAAASETLNKTKRIIKGNTSAGDPENQPRAWLPAFEDIDDHLDNEDRALVASMSPLDRRLYMGFHHHQLPNLLRNFDRLSMAHGVESRMPLMDWRVVCYGFALPETAKLGGGQTKRVLREAMRGIMPESLRTRRSKIGFTSPTPNWFRGSLGDWVAAEVSKPSFLDHPMWDGPAIQEFVNSRHRAGTWTLRDCERIWPYMQTHLWRESFFGTDRVRLNL